VREMISFPWSADRSRARAGTEWTGVQMPSKYAGHLPWMQSNAISAILYVMRTCAPPSAFLVSFVNSVVIEMEEIWHK